PGQTPRGRGLIASMVCTPGSLPSSLRVPSSIGLALAMLALVGCGDDAGGGGTSGSGVPPLDSGTVTEGDSVDATAGTIGTGADTTAGCPAALVCGEQCCAEGELCTDGQCVLDCGAEPPCGDVCCGDGEICYVGQCVVPGAPC